MISLIIGGPRLLPAACVFIRSPLDFTPRKDRGTSTRPPSHRQYPSARLQHIMNGNGHSEPDGLSGPALHPDRGLVSTQSSQPHGHRRLMVQHIARLNAAMGDRFEIIRLEAPASRDSHRGGNGHGYTAAAAAGSSAGAGSGGGGTDDAVDHGTRRSTVEYRMPQSTHPVTHSHPATPPRLAHASPFNDHTPQGSLGGSGPDARGRSPATGAIGHRNEQLWTGPEGTMNFSQSPADRVLGSSHRHLGQRVSSSRGVGIAAGGGGGLMPTRAKHQPAQGDALDWADGLMESYTGVNGR